MNRDPEVCGEYQWRLIATVLPLSLTGLTQLGDMGIGNQCQIRQLPCLGPKLASGLIGLIDLIAQLA